METPQLDKKALLAHFQRAKKRLFLLDYDGTLTPIVVDPQAAIPSHHLLETINTLSTDPNNSIWIISGRDQVFLDKWLGHLTEIGLSAEHGAFIRKPKSLVWDHSATETDLGWQEDTMKIFQAYIKNAPGSFVEQKRVSLTWHYRSAEVENTAFLACECRKEIEDQIVKKWDVEVIEGKKNVEVKPVTTNKGTIVEKITRDFERSTGQAPDFVLCLGDDSTDEGPFFEFFRINLFFFKLADYL